MDPWVVRGQIEELLNKERLYERYFDLCLRVESQPISQDAFLDRYVDIFVHRQELFDQASENILEDKKRLLEDLEQSGAPIEDLVSVDMLPPSVTISLNTLSDGMICLYVLFPDGSNRPVVQLAHVGSGESESTFL